MSRLHAALIFTLLWAAIYLPGLGSTELKGEEGRRILPAVTMLETGNWLVPYVGGKPYLRKPPLVNWAIAGAFRLTGVRNEWTARLPSALAVLALGWTIVGCASGRGWMTPETGLVAAIMAMTSFGLLAKARFAGAEIEGIYVPLAGIATVLWMAGWVQRRPAWFTWIAPWVFLGVAMLAKGPVHLLFFYAVVAGTLWKGRALRELAHPAHGAGLLVMAGIFAAWAIPYFKTEQAGAAMSVWKDQMANRVTENVFEWGSYLSNLPRGLGDLLPWVLFAPLVVRGFRTIAAAEDGRIAPAYRGALPASVLMFAGMLLVPGVLPRYVLPAAIPWMLLTALALDFANEASPALAHWRRVNRSLAMLLFPLAILAPLAAGTGRAMALNHGRLDLTEFDWSAALPAAIGATACLALAAFTLARRDPSPRPPSLAIVSASLLGAFAIIYATAAVPAINARDNIRPVARRIDAALKPGERLVICDPGYLPVIFYLKTPHRYAAGADEIPRGADAVLALGKHESKLARKRPDLRVVERFEAREGNELLLLRPGTR